MQENGHHHGAQHAQEQYNPPATGKFVFSFCTFITPYYLCTLLNCREVRKLPTITTTRYGSRSKQVFPSQAS